MLELPIRVSRLNYTYGGVAVEGGEDQVGEGQHADPHPPHQEHAVCLSCQVITPPLRDLSHHSNRVQLSVKVTGSHK